MSGTDCITPLFFFGEANIRLVWLIVFVDVPLSNEAVLMSLLARLC